MIERLDKLMPGSLRRAGVEKQIAAAVIAEAVRLALVNRFGDAAASQMRVKRFKNGIAAVTCAASVLAEDIRLSEPELVDEINRRLGERKVERVIATS